MSEKVSSSIGFEINSHSTIFIFCTPSKNDLLNHIEIHFNHNSELLSGSPKYVLWYYHELFWKAEIITISGTVLNILKKLKGERLISPLLLIVLQSNWTWHQLQLHNLFIITLQEYRKG